MARKLGVIQSGQALEMQVEAAPLDEMNAHVLQVTIPEKSRMHGVYVVPAAAAGAGRPSRCCCGTASRCTVNPNIRLQSGDQLLIVAPERVRAATERRLRAVGRGGALAMLVR